MQLNVLCLFIAHRLNCGTLSLAYYLADKVASHSGLDKSMVVFAQHAGLALSICLILTNHHIFAPPHLKIERMGATDALIDCGQNPGAAKDDSIRCAQGVIHCCAMKLAENAT